MAPQGDSNPCYGCAPARRGHEPAISATFRNIVATNAVHAASNCAAVCPWCLQWSRGGSGGASLACACSHSPFWLRSSPRRTRWRTSASIRTRVPRRIPVRRVTLPCYRRRRRPRPLLCPPSRSRGGLPRRRPSRFRAARPSSLIPRGHRPQLPSSNSFDPAPPLRHTQSCRRRRRIGHQQQTDWEEDRCDSSQGYFYLY